MFVDGCMHVHVRTVLYKVRGEIILKLSTTSRCIDSWMRVDLDCQKRSEE